MAVFYFNVRVLSASTGASAVMAAAYRHAAKMYSEKNCVQKNYDLKAKELAHEEIVLPSDAPKWAVDRYGTGDVVKASEQLWNDIEKREAQSKRWAPTAQLSRNLEIALPIELSRADQIQLVREFLQKNFASQGMIADWVIHDPEGKGNPHAHVMLTMRGLAGDGWGLKNRDWNKRPLTVEWRRAWADFANAALERAGFEARIDHRTLEAQGIELEPDTYNPHVARHAEAAGDFARERARALAAREANRAFLTANPEHILVVLNARKTIFTFDDIKDELKRRGLDKGLAERVMYSPELVQMAEPNWRGEAQYATRTQQIIESRMVTGGMDLAAAQLTLAEGQGEEELSPNLNKGQENAARAMIAPERLTLVTGYAGSGKTFTLREVARVWNDRGYEVLGGAISGKASQELDGIVGLKAASLAAWEARWAAGLRHDRPFVFVMDEAGMVGSNSWARIQERVADMGGKLIAVGDAEQLQPIASGSAFKMLQDKIGSHVIDFVVRQKEIGDREATRSLADPTARSVPKAIRHYLDTGGIILEPTEANAFEAIVDGYFAGDAPRGRIALAHRNVDVDALNVLLRERAVELNKVDDEAGVKYLRPLPEDMIEARAREPIRLAPGDRVRFTRPESEQSVQRSAFGTVVSAKPDELVVAIDADGVPTREVRLDPRSTLDLDYGYAATIHKSQGMTVSRVQVLGSETLNQHLAYVALSRHVDRVEMHMPIGALRRDKDFGELTAKQLFNRLCGLASRKGYMSLTDGLDPRSLAGALPSAVPMFHEVLQDLANRPDIRMPQVTPRKVGAIGDVGLVQSVTRMAGLIDADYEVGQSPFRSDAPRPVEDAKVFLEEFAARRAVFSIDDFAGALSEAVREPTTFTRLFFEAMSHPDLVLIGETKEGAGKGRLYSMGQQLRAELSLSDRALRLAGRGGQIAGDRAIAADRFSLTDEQRSAFEGVLQGRGLSVLTGSAGSGVTRTLGAIHHDYDQAGYEVIAVAATGPGVRALQQIEGAKPMSLAGFEWRVRSGLLKLGPKSVVLIDQAEQLGVVAMDEVLRRVEDAGARAVLASTAPSLEGFAAGAAVRLVAERTGSFALEEVHRQRQGADRQAVEHLFKDNSAAAVRHFVDAGQVVSSAGRSDQRAALVAGYLADGAAQKIALTLSKADAATLNMEIRAALRGQIPEAERSVEVMVGRGDERSEIALAAGDRITFGARYRQFDILSGTSADVLAVSAGRVTVAIGANETRREITFDPAEVAKFDYGWATTIARASSDGVASVHVLTSSGVDLAAARRAFSRHTDQLRIYVPVEDREATAYLSGLIGRDRAPMNAVDLAADASRAAEASRQVVYTPERAPSSARSVFEAIPALADRADVSAPVSRPARVPTEQDRHLSEVAAQWAGVLASGYKSEIPAVQPEAAAWLESPQSVVDDLLQRQSAISAADVARRLARGVNDPTVFSRLFFEAMAHPDLVEVTDHTKAGQERLYSTPDQVLKELELADRAVALAGRQAERGAIRHREKDYLLNADQRGALDQVLQGRGLSVLTGPAGSGVTWTLGAAHHAYDKAGFTVVGIAATGGGVDALRERAGLDAMTFAAFGHRLNSGRVTLDAKTVVLVDQAERLSVRELNALLAGVEASGARVVLGSSAYSQDPMEAGSAFRLIAERAGMAELGAVERQRSIGDRQAALDLAAGGARAKAAVGHYIDAGQVVIAGQGPRGNLEAAAVKALAEGFAADPAYSKIALAHSKASAEALNREIRTALRARLPEDKRPEEHLYQRGEGMEPLALAAGDRIAFAKGIYELGLRAGASAEVVRTAPEAVTLAVGQGDARQFVQLRPDQLAGADYSYATTVHRASSYGVSSVHVLATAGMDHTTAARAFTRQTEALKIYVPQSDMAAAREQLENTVTREQPARSAIDALTDKGAAMRAAFDALRNPDKNLEQAWQARSALGRFLDRANIWVDEKLRPGREEPAQVQGADRARSVEELLKRFFERGMVAYDAQDDAFRTDPSAFARALRTKLVGDKIGTEDLPRFHRANLGRLWYNLEGKVATGEIGDKLDAAAVTLASPEFYKRLIGELEPRARQEVEQLTREFAQVIHGAPNKPTERTFSMASLFVALDATGRDVARDMVGRMLQEDYRHLMPQLARAHGVEPAEARAVADRRKEAAIAQDAALGRAKPRNLDHEKDRGAFGWER